MPWNIKYKDALEYTAKWPHFDFFCLSLNFFSFHSFSLNFQSFFLKINLISSSSIFYFVLMIIFSSFCLLLSAWRVWHIKGAQAWDIRLLVYYTIKAYLSRRLQNWKKKLVYSSYWMYFRRKPHYAHAEHALNDLSVWWACAQCLMLLSACSAYS